MMELPEYRWPNLRNLVMGLWERAKIFLTRVGTIILALMIVLWFLSTYPGAAAGRHRPGHRIQLRRHAGPRAAGGVRADRLQLADLASRWCRAWPRAKWRWARWARCMRCRPAADNVDAALTPLIAAQLEPAHGAVAAGLVRVRAAVPVDAGHGEARDQLLALSADHGRLPVRAGLCGVVPHLPHCAGGDGMSRLLAAVDRGVAGAGRTAVRDLAAVTGIAASAGPRETGWGAWRLRLLRDRPCSVWRIGCARSTSRAVAPTAAAASNPA